MAYRNKCDQALCSHRHYERNKEKMMQKAKKFKILARRRNKEFIEEYLRLHPCVDCKETDIIVLEFDHVKGEKKGNIADIVNRGWSINKIEEEISKCEVRCANCHRRITHKRRKIVD